MASVINRSTQAITINETAHVKVRLFIAEGLIFTTAPIIPRTIPANIYVNKNQPTKDNGKWANVNACTLTAYAYRKRE
jgi:hypothetical protein